MAAARPSVHHRRGVGAAKGKRGSVVGGVCGGRARALLAHRITDFSGVGRHPTSVVDMWELVRLHQWVGQDGGGVTIIAHTLPQGNSQDRRGNRWPCFPKGRGEDLHRSVPLSAVARLAKRGTA